MPSTDPRTPRPDRARQRKIRARIRATGEDFPTAAAHVDQDHHHNGAQAAPAVEQARLKVAEWAPLVGVHITLTRTDTGATLRGVLLPPTPDHIGRARIACTHRDGAPCTEPIAPVVDLDPLQWTPDIAPADVDKRLRPSRKATRGWLGLPLYRHDDLPATALATVTMLSAEHRRVPATDQQPVAEYQTMKRPVPLYAVPDTTTKPPLSPARQASWDAVRTCTRCGTRKARPLGTGFDDARYCQSCLEPAMRDWWHAQRAVERTEAIQWARGVLADPNTVLVRATWSMTSPLIAIELDGTLLAKVDRRVWVNKTPPHGRDPEQYVGLPELAEIGRRLAPRREVTWGTATNIGRWLAEHGVTDLGETLNSDAGDLFDDRYTAWIGTKDRYSGDSYAWQKPRLRKMPQPHDPAAIVAHMRTVLEEMAAGAPSAERLAATKLAEKDGRWPDDVDR